MSTCPKCGAKIGPDEPAYVMEPFARYVCEGCWRGTSRAYRRSAVYDPYKSYLKQRRVTIVAALLMIVILLGLAILIGRCS